jgi:hypothetical protein
LEEQMMDDTHNGDLPKQHAAEPVTQVLSADGMDEGQVEAGAPAVTTHEPLAAALEVATESSSDVAAPAPDGSADPADEAVMPLSGESPDTPEAHEPTEWAAEATDSVPETQETVFFSDQWEADFAPRIKGLHEHVAEVHQKLDKLSSH